MDSGRKTSGTNLSFEGLRTMRIASAASESNTYTTIDAILNVSEEYAGMTSCMESAARVTKATLKIHQNNVTKYRLENTLTRRQKVQDKT
jgi:hypothetical protein